MTLRGRLTIAALVMTGMLGCVAVAARVVDAPPAPLPSVDAAPRPPVVPEAPRHLLMRLPSGREQLELVEEGFAPGGGARFVESLAGPPDLPGPLRVEYAFDADLTEEVFDVLRRGRVKRGHVIVMNPTSGRVIAFASTNAEAFPPDRSYPAASLVKVVTAAAALDHAPSEARRPCVYAGNPYRLRRSQLAPPRRGHTVSLERALATSNNQCFARLAVNTVGASVLLDTFARFGFLDEPAPGHAPGDIANVEDDDFALGRLGCGLSGCRITPLHAAELAATLATGERTEPWWVHRVLDADGRSLRLPRRPPAARVMSRRLADELRGMLVRTTTHGTAKSAFRDRRGRAKLGDIRVAGKTGNLTGTDPYGRYEWFIGLAPAARPNVAVAVVQVHDDLYWQNSSQIAAEVLRRVFCEDKRCQPELAGRFIAPAAVGLGTES